MKLRLALPLLAACSGPDPERLLDTGWFPDDTAGIAACGKRVVARAPADGATGWGWRAPLRLDVSRAWPGYAAELLDDRGAPVPITLTPSEDGVRYEVVAEEGLRPSTTYTWRVTDCAGPESTTFTTSDLGAPLAGGPASLIGRTWQLDLQGATWLEPGGFGALLAVNFNTPVLAGVRYADATYLDLIGGQGVAGAGGVYQSGADPTWDFPVVSFEGAPWFEARAASVQLEIGGYALPVTDFVYAGTFTPDGSQIADGVLRGLGDTRYAGGAINRPDDPGAFCAFGEGVGVQCEACPDGQVYCIRVWLTELDAPEVEGLTLVPRVAEPGP